MKYFTLYILLFLFSGCDDRLEFLDELNNVPEISVVTQSDSLKTSLKNGSNQYTINLTLNDPETDLQRLDFTFLQGSGTFFYNGTVIENNSLAIDQTGQKRFTFEPSTVGLIDFNMDLFDNLNKSVTQNFKLFVFDNLPPVAKFEISQIRVPTERTFRFDASQSFDQDDNFGGGIASYHWDINGAQIIWDEPILPQELSPGNYEIKLTVIDNDGQASETISTIQPL